VSACGRLQGEFCFQKVAARCQLNGHVMWALECRDQWRENSGSYFPHRITPPESHLTLNGPNI
jgi:hypothetical protein